MMYSNKDIVGLFNYKQSKELNDYVTKKREILFIEMFNTKNTNSITTQLYDKLNKMDIIPTECIGKGGRTDSFDMIFKCNDNILYNAELKVLSSYKLPQLSDISLKKKDYNIITNQYKLFVDSWALILSNIKKEFNMINNIPTVDELYDNLSKITICNPFIKELKQIISDKDKNKILNDHSIKHIDNFLTNNINMVNKNNIIEQYKQKLNCKDLMIIYNRKTQNLNVKKNTKDFTLDIKSISLQKCRYNKYNIGLNVVFIIINNNIETLENVIIRLRWKNNNGILNPAWKLDNIIMK